VLLPDIRAASEDEFFVFKFQQNSAPSRRAKDTMLLLEQEAPDFIPPRVLKTGEHKKLKKKFRKSAKAIQTVLEVFGRSDQMSFKLCRVR